MLHAPTVDVPVAQAIARRPREWTAAKVESAAGSRRDLTEPALLTLIDVLEDIGSRGDAEAKLFVSALGRIATLAPLDAADTETEVALRVLVARLAVEARVVDLAGFMPSWTVLMSGMVVRMLGGDLSSAPHVRVMVADLLARFGDSLQHAVSGLADDFSSFDIDAE